MSDAVLYGRYSPRPPVKQGEQRPPEEHESLETQLARMRQYCEGLAGLSPAVELKDPETSARKVPLAERKGGKELVKIVGRGKKYQHVVAQRLDRLFRDPEDGMKWLLKWDKQGVKLHLADQGGCTIDTSTATGRLIARLLLSVAAFEPDMTAERISAASHVAQANGLRRSRYAPYGMMIDPENSSRIVENPAETPIVEKVCQMWDEGERNLSAIVRALEAGGKKYPSRGKRGWHHQKVKRILVDQGKVRG